MTLALSRRSALRLGGAALLAALVPVPLDLGGYPRRLPLRPGADGAELTIPPDVLDTLAPHGRGQWAVFCHFTAPVLVLFPAIDMAGVHRLVDGLFAPDGDIHDLLVALMLAEAREVEAGAVVLAPDLMAHAGLSDRVELVPFPDHLLLRAPGRA